MSAEKPTPQTTERTIEQSTAALQNFAERDGIGAKNREEVHRRIAKVAEIITDNPDRVQADTDKPWHKTEHDPERAHLMALAIGGNMTRLASDALRRRQGKRLGLFRTEAAQDRDRLGAELGMRLAGETYDAEPLSASPNSVEYRREAAIVAGAKSYKFIDSAPSQK